MCAARPDELERVTTLAKAVVAPLAEVWSKRAGATVRIDNPQAAELEADELGRSLEGWFWVLPVEVTGVYSGAFSLLIEQSLLVSHGAPPGVTDDISAGRFAAIIDEFLAAAADRLTATAGSAITLDRLGLREVPGAQAAEILVEFLGKDELVVVSFAAEVSALDASEAARSGGVAVVFGSGLARELGGSRATDAETVTPLSALGAPPSLTPGRAPSAEVIDALFKRAGNLKLTLTAEVGRKTMLLGDLLRLRRGSVIDLGRSVGDPLEIRLGGRVAALGDAVVLPTGYGVRIRG